MAVSVLSIVGSFALNNSFNDVIIMLVAAIIGFLFRVGGFPTGPFILGLLLGSMLESNFRRSLILSQGSPAIFFTRPICCVLLIVIVLVLLRQPLSRLLMKKRPSAGENAV